MINKKRNEKQMKKVITPVKPFIVGQLAIHDAWDGGRGNTTITTRLVKILTIEKTEALAVLESGSLLLVNINDLRHLPDAFQGATL